MVLSGSNSSDLCASRLMAALYRWNKTTRAAARIKLGSAVVRILGASGYACRKNVDNLPDGNLSQHAFANAIDIGALRVRMAADKAGNYPNPNVSGRFNGWYFRGDFRSARPCL